ncbi:DUF5060 domain-containing protein [Lutibacter sp. HS1-25]|uniref:DUF5060 domain-containing protein n=1 Tax=Lutibacter sp. HS1-25 TaxID=2485000 RepID=UPI00197BACD8|nr:DUF5060 domain-containing protein [Lutibacter sp. HS1-25]
MKIYNILKRVVVGIFFLLNYFNLQSQNVEVLTGGFNEKNGLIVVEAEDFTSQTKSEVRKWQIVKSTSVLGDNIEDSHAKTASGNAYIKILPDTRKTHADKLISGENFTDKAGEVGVVSYKVNFQTAGRYYVWAKVFSTGTEDNGIHVGIDGEWPESGKRMQWCEGKKSWFWESKQRTKEVHCGVPFQIYLDVEKPGIHDIQFSMREDGVEMDQWLMTTNKDFNPRNDPKYAMTETKVDNESFLDLVKKASPEAIVISALDFENTENKFYVNNNWLAINPNKNKEASASAIFNGNSGLYDVVLFTVGENDGRSKYTISVNSFIQGNFSPPLSTSAFEEGPAYAKSFADVQLNNNEKITVTAEIGSKDGKEFSRARWIGIAIVSIGQGENLIQNIQTEAALHTVVKKSGEFKKWHKVTLTFDGPETAEDDEYNPFFNYRFNVTFTHNESGKKYVVPGYFAADGNAGETSAIKGNKWRVHFAPDEIGEWNYKVDFRKGRWVAVSDRNKPGDTGGFMDGATGSFTVEKSDKTGRDFRGKGRLQYVGERYLKFAETGEYFLKVGSDAPENFLSYADFDGTFHNDGHKDNMVKTWTAHLQDWKDGDPTWQNGKGKAMIGALNYLASKGLNAFSFLTNNIKGDDQNVFPYVDYDNWDRFDVSKLDQWEIVFEHADKLGMFLHFKTLEMENQGLLDNGGVGANSKLYYRELIARFGHHLALNWNTGEENGDWVKNHPTPPQFTQERLSMAAYFNEHDPYKHHVVIHNGNPFTDLLGPNSKYTGPSIQTHHADFRLIHKEVLHWIEASKKAGKQWAVAVDEPGDAQHALMPDADDPDHDLARRNGLWSTFMAGGWGTEWYFGYKHDHSDLTCEDYRSRDLFWNQGVIALNFFKENKIPFWEMENKNELVGNSANENTVYCFAKENDTYLVYLNSVETASLDLREANGDFQVYWFNPKKGGALLQTKIKKVKGGSSVELGQSPNKKQQDWLIIISKK